MLRVNVQLVSSETGAHVWSDLFDEPIADLATGQDAIGWNSERFDGRNLALRLVALGYTNVVWYRGGREA